MEKNKIKLSIIVPVYNVERYVEECIDSVLSQWREDYEMILINDGSTDSSGKILEKYKDHPGVVLIEQENRGLSGARNAGLRLARGEYIAFLDSDDALLPDALWERICLLDRYPQADFIVSPYLQVDESAAETLSDGLKKENNISQRVELVEKEDYLKSFLTARYPAYYAVWGKIFRRSFWGNIRFKERINFEDVVADAFIYRKAKKLLVCSRPAYVYNVRENSIITSAFDLKKYKDEFYANFCFVSYCLGQNTIFMKGFGLLLLKNLLKDRRFLLGGNDRQRHLYRKYLRKYSGLLTRNLDFHWFRQSFASFRDPMERRMFGKLFKVYVFTPWLYLHKYAVFLPEKK